MLFSSPTGLRTIHLLRSILFRALPSHAIGADLQSVVCAAILTQNWRQVVIQANTSSLSQHVRVSWRKFPLDFTRLVGPALWRSLIYLLSCRWWNARDFSSKVYKASFINKYRTFVFVAIWNFHVSYSPHFTNIEFLFYICMKIAQTRLAINPTVIHFLRKIRNDMSLSRYNNINNLRVYYKPVCLLCRKEPVCFLVSRSNHWLVNDRPVSSFSHNIAMINLREHVHHSGSP